MCRRKLFTLSEEVGALSQGGFIRVMFAPTVGQDSTDFIRPHIYLLGHLSYFYLSISVFLFVLTYPVPGRPRVVTEIVMEDGVFIEDMNVLLF